MTLQTLKPRIISLTIAFIGFVLAAVNHRTVINERNFYPMLLLFGPVCVLIGIGGAIDPRILNQTEVEPARAVTMFRAISIALVLAGLSVGWAMGHYWYHIW